MVGWRGKPALAPSSILSPSLGLFHHYAIQDQLIVTMAVISISIDD